MERVVITGIGLVTPVGVGNRPTFDALLEGKSGAAPIEQFDAHDGFPSRFACEVKNYDPAEYMPRKKIKEAARFITFSMGATKLAFQDSGLELSEEERERAGCFIGVGLGGLERLEHVKMVLEQSGSETR